MLGTTVRPELGLTVADEEWLSSATVSRRGSTIETARWQGTMTGRLSTSHIELAPGYGSASAAADSVKLGVSLAHRVGRVLDSVDLGGEAVGKGIESLP